MTAICDAAIHLCRLRLTRLDSLGNAKAGPNNVYVSDNPLQLQVKIDVEAGQDKTLVGGCDCIVASYRGYDKIKRFTFELDLATLEPALLEMMTGGTAILDTGGNPIGINWPVNLSCSSPQQPPVALEAWQDMWDVDHQNPIYPYVQFVWPMTFWTLGDMTLQNDFNQPKLMGFSRSNPRWASGVFHDYPQAIGDAGGFFGTSQIPTAACGYQSHAIT